jgi:hypothetical protein
MCMLTATVQECRQHSKKERLAHSQCMIFLLQPSWLQDDVQMAFLPIIYIPLSWHICTQIDAHVTSAHVSALDE